MTRYIVDSERHRDSGTFQSSNFLGNCISSSQCLRFLTKRHTLHAFRWKEIPFQTSNLKQFTQISTSSKLRSYTKVRYKTRSSKKLPELGNVERLSRLRRKFDYSTIFAMERKNPQNLLILNHNSHNLNHKSWLSFDLNEYKLILYRFELFNFPNC